MAEQRRGAGWPVPGLVLGVVLELVAGAIAFLTHVPLAAVVLFLVGIVCLGASGDALRRRRPGRRHREPVPRG